MNIEMVYVGKDKKRGTRALALKLPTKKLTGVTILHRLFSCICISNILYLVANSKPVVVILSFVLQSFLLNVKLPRENRRTS